jgi:hypothetical protein
MWVHLACEPLSKQIHENEKNVDNVSHTVVSQSAVTFHAQKKISRNFVILSQHQQLFGSGLFGRAFVTNNVTIKFLLRQMEFIRSLNTGSS